MKNHITIGEVSIPLLDFVVSRNALLGITKSGKTYTAKGIAEQLLDLKVPIVVFDAIGVWRWLKVPRDGGKGYQVVVAGGADPDLPLTPHSAPEIVRAAIRENIPLVIDLYDSKLSKADWRRIVQECFRILLYENKGLRHIFLEEAAEYVPQRIMDGNVYAEVEKLARMGGNASLGLTLINQRAQELNKAVLELCDNIILLRQRGSHAIDSLEKWMDRLAPDLANKIASSMPHMTQGDCWVFTERDETPIRTRSSQINSFHPDRRNPESVKASKASVNTDAFVKAMSGTLEKLVEESRANDPATLKRRISELEKQIAAQMPKIEKVPELTAEEAKRLGELVKAIEALPSELRELVATVEGLQDDAKAFKRILDKPPAYVIQSHPIRRPALPPASVPAGDLTGTQQKILDCIATLGVRGLTPNREMIARWLSIHPNGGRYGSDLARLRESGYINGCALTDLGKRSARPNATGLDGLCIVLDGTQKNIVGVLSHGAEMTRESLAEALGIHPNGGRYGSDLAKLRTMGVLPDRGTIKLTEAAFA